MDDDHDDDADDDDWTHCGRRGKGRVRERVAWVAKDSARRPINVFGVFLFSVMGE